MNKQLLIALQKRNKQRLTDLRAKIEDPETREDELAEIKDEIDTITEELQSVADSLSELDDEDEDGDGTADDERGDGQSLFLGDRRRHLLWWRRTTLAKRIHQGILRAMS